MRGTSEDVDPKTRLHLPSPATPGAPVTPPASLLLRQELQQVVDGVRWLVNEKVFVQVGHEVLDFVVDLRWAARP